MKEPSFPQVRHQFTVLRGGIDHASALSTANPGSLVVGVNFQVVQTGGYRMISGYERFDGRQSPSRTAFTALILNTDVVGSASMLGGFTVLGHYQNELYVFGDVTGAYPPGTTIMYDGVEYTVSLAVLNGGKTNAVHNNMRAAAADLQRTMITAVPGVGPVYGVVAVEGGVLAFRSGTGYISTALGWHSVAVQSQIDITNLTTPLVAGMTVTGGVSGATATIDAVYLVYGAGTTSQPGSGTIFVSFIMGTFRANEPLLVSGVQVCTTVTGVIAPVPTIGPLRSVLTTFVGSGPRTVYFVDGVTDRIYVYRSLRLFSVPLGLTDAGLKDIAAHAGRLFVAARSSVFISSSQNPLRFDAVEDAMEFAVGTPVTAIVSFRGESDSDALFVGTERDVFMLYGKSGTSWKLDVVAADISVLPGCAAFVGNDVLFASVDGIYSLRAVDVYGNFSVSKITQQLDAFYSEWVLSSLLAVVAVPHTNECRFLCSNGVALSCVFVPSKTGGSYQFTTYDYTPAKFYDFASALYDDVVLVFGASDSYVYQFDAGTSFDGAEYSAFFVTAYNVCGTPCVRKRFRRAFLELNAPGYSNVMFAYDVSPFGDESFRSETAPIPTTMNTLVYSTAKYFDAAVWDRFVWSHVSTSSPLDTPGTGVGISLLVRCVGKTNDPFTITGYTVTYTFGRGARG